MTPLNSLSVMTESYIMIKEFLKEDPAKKVKDPSKKVEGPSNKVEGPSKKVEGPSNKVEGPSKKVEGPSNKVDPLAAREKRIGQNLTDLIAKDQGESVSGVKVEGVKGQGVKVEGQGIKDPRKFKLNLIEKFKDLITFVTQYSNTDEMENNPTFKTKLGEFKQLSTEYESLDHNDELDKTLDSLGSKLENEDYNGILDEIASLESKKTSESIAYKELIAARVKVEKLKDQLSELKKPNPLGARYVTAIKAKEKELLAAKTELEFEEQKPQSHIQKRLNQKINSKQVERNPQQIGTGIQQIGTGIQQIGTQRGTVIGGSFNPLLKNVN